MNDSRDSARGGRSRRWTLWRQDDHGNRFVVARFESRDDAERAMREFESGYPHHQTFWVTGPSSTD